MPSPLIAHPAAYLRAQNLTDGTFAVTQREELFRPQEMPSGMPLSFMCAMSLTWASSRDAHSMRIWQAHFRLKSCGIIRVRSCWCGRNTAKGRTTLPRPEAMALLPHRHRRGGRAWAQARQARRGALLRQPIPWAAPGGLLRLLSRPCPLHGRPFGQRLLAPGD